MTKHGTKDPDPAVKARAEARFQMREEQKRERKSATDEYEAKQEAERNKMARMRKERLAREATKSDKAKR